MGREIERRFIVGSFSKMLVLSTLPEKTELIEQGYIPTNNGTTERVRLCTNHITGEQKAYMTIKGPRETPMTGKAGKVKVKLLGKASSRDEDEYEIPLDEARDILDNMCTSTLYKTRYYFDYKHHGQVDHWILDCFTEDRHRGLMIAEIEKTNKHDDPTSNPHIANLNTIALPPFINPNNEVTLVRSLTSHNLAGQEDGFKRDLKKALERTQMNDLATQHYR